MAGHPDRAPRELVFLADLTVELRAWPADTWSRSASSRRRPPVRWWPLGRAATCWACGWAGLTAEEALALERPAVTYVRGQLGDRLQRQLAHAYRQWWQPSSGRRPDDHFP